MMMDRGLERDSITGKLIRIGNKVDNCSRFQKKLKFLRKNHNSKSQTSKKFYRHKGVSSSTENLHRAVNKRSLLVIPFNK